MRHLHNLSHQHKMSTDMGLLVPCATMEVLPGDTYIHGTRLIARVAPLVNPVMHDVDIRVHNWFVPNRILLDDWEDWIVGKSVSAMPTINVPAAAADYALFDHMGIPPATGKPISALPIYAYNRIWNEFYRDQDLQTERAEDDTTLARICWEKDYFTTARDVPQQGDAVSIGFSSGEAAVTGIGMKSTGSFGVTNEIVKETDGSPGTETYAKAVQTSNSGNIQVEEDPNNAGYPNIRADLSQMTGGIDIDDLRRAMALQSFAEVRARFGSRYVDYLRYLGANPGDHRLNRPEYLGGGTQQINFSEVLATAEGSSTSVGDMFGHGIAGLRSRRYRRGFQEHGWMLSMLSVRPKTVYMNGIMRKFQRADPMDYWQKELEVLPWQELKAGEVYHAAADVNSVFGYVPRFDEYRHELSYASGNFRTGPEKDWHMARDFTSEPTLNSSFVECTPTDRIYGDTTMPELLLNINHSIKAKRLVRSNARFGMSAL